MIKRCWLSLVTVGEVWRFQVALVAGLERRGLRRTVLLALVGHAQQRGVQLRHDAVRPHRHLHLVRAPLQGSGAGGGGGAVLLLGYALLRQLLKKQHSLVIITEQKNSNFLLNSCYFWEKGVIFQQNGATKVVQLFHVVYFYTT